MPATIFQSATLVRPAAIGNRTSSSRALWAGRILSGIAVLFLAADTLGHLLGVRQVVEATVQLGFAPEHVLVLGLIELGCLVLYLIPRTALLGAVLWTGYFGGAIATHLRMDNPLFSHTLFP